MPTYQNQTDYNQFNQNQASDQGYDLASEKQRIAEGTAEIKKELQEKWQQRYGDAQIFPDALSGMSRNLIDFLLSFEHTLFYNDLAKKFNLSQEQRDVLPQIVWHLCQNKNWNDLSELLQKNIELAPEANNQIAQSLSAQILSQAKELSSGETVSKTTSRASEENKPTLLQMPLTQALKEIPEIGEQLLTSEKIHILSFPEPVRPSLKNWLADYTSFFGYAKHSPIEMGNYLFHSENTKKLSSSDRQKLTYILKSFNDGTSVSINKTLKQVVFPSIDRQITNPNFQAPNTSPTGRQEFQTQNSNFQNTVSQTSEQITNPKLQISNNIQALNSKFQITPSQSAQRMQPTPSLQTSIPRTTSLPTTNQKPETNNMTFSSPQKLPYEAEKEIPLVPKPASAAPVPPANLPFQNNQSERNNPNTVILEKKPDPPRPIGRNVVDLREV